MKRSAQISHHRRGDEASVSGSFALFRVNNRLRAVDECDGDDKEVFFGRGEKKRFLFPFGCFSRSTRSARVFYAFMNEGFKSETGSRFVAFERARAKKQTRENTPPHLKTFLFVFF